jgi:hypothetical protein
MVSISGNATDSASLLLCTSLRSGGIVPHILTATFPGESHPLPIEQEAGVGPRASLQVLEKGKKVGNKMMIEIADQTNISPRMTEHVYLYTIKSAATELQTLSQYEALLFVI